MADGAGEMEKLAPGLYLVATPIGNLGDITLRALEVLRAVDLIACEDTRQTQKLLNHFQIEKLTVSYHQYNERERAAELEEKLRQGARIAVVSDAGMPGISDPGSWLVKTAIAVGVRVCPVPGATAALSALVASGLNTERFCFEGFLPEKAGERRTRLEELAELAALTMEKTGEAPATIVFYEAPHRIEATLQDIEAVWGRAVRLALARELTKIHEEFLRGTVAEVREQLGRRERIRGEIVLLVEPARLAAEAGTIEPLIKRVAALAEQGLEEKEALKRLARETGRAKSELYRELQRERARR